MTSVQARKRQESSIRYYQNPQRASMISRNWRLEKKYEKSMMQDGSFHCCEAATPAGLQMTPHGPLEGRQKAREG